MNSEQFIQSIYHDRWLGHNLKKFDDYYAKDVSVTISISKKSANVDDVTLDYQGVLEQAQWQHKNRCNFEFDFKRIFGGDDNRITLYFFSKQVDKKTGETHHYRVCAFYELNDQNKIQRCCVVMTPYYPFGYEAKDEPK